MVCERELGQEATGLGCESCHEAMMDGGKVTKQYPVKRWWCRRLENILLSIAELIIE
jgi:hypothetical protein